MAYLCTLTDLQARLSTIGVTLRVDDDPDSIGQILQRATNKELLYVEPLYDRDQVQMDADAGGWTNDRACDLAAYYLCTRRGNLAPASVKEEYKSCIADLESIRDDECQIPMLAQRHRSSPTFSNVRIDTSYVSARIRVERTMSENSPTIGYSQYTDWATIAMIEY